MITNKIGITILGFFILGLIITSFTVIGNPVIQKSIRIDETTLNNFSGIQNDIHNFYRLNKSLPQDLQDLTTISTDKIADSNIDNGYKYEVVNDTTYKLCAEFNTDFMTFKKYSDYMFFGLNEYGTKIDFIKGYDCLEFIIPSYVINETVIDIKTPTLTANTQPDLDSKPTNNDLELNLITTSQIPKSDDFALVNVGVTGLDVEIVVGNNTGCPKTEQTYTMYHNGVFNRNLRLYLTFDDGENNCEAYKTEKLTFNLKQIDPKFFVGINSIQVVNATGNLTRVPIDLKSLPVVTPSPINNSKPTQNFDTKLLDLKSSQKAIIERNKYCLNNPDDEGCTY